MYCWLTVHSCSWMASGRRFARWICRFYWSNLSNQAASGASRWVFSVDGALPALTCQWWFKAQSSHCSFPSRAHLRYCRRLFFASPFRLFIYFPLCWRETDSLRPRTEDTRGSLWSLQWCHSMPAHLRALALNMVIPAVVVWLVKRTSSSGLQFLKSAGQRCGSSGKVG